MNEFKPEASRIDTVAARLELPGQECYAAYVGLDVHKETIAVAVALAVAEPGRQEPRSEGEIANRPKSIEKLVRRLSERFGGGVLQFVYEAGPCGYGLYHQLAGTDISVRWWRRRAFPRHRRSGSRLTVGMH